MERNDFLLEIGCEELPARLVDFMVEQLGERFIAWCDQERISIHSLETFATPRRLAILVRDMADKQGSAQQEIKGPPLKVAQTEEGTWTQAATGFARKNGCVLQDLMVKEIKGEAYLFAQVEQMGLSTIELLKHGLPKLLSQLSLASSMRWGSENTRFIRPVRWLVCLFGSESVPFTWAGCNSSNETRGHHFLGTAINLMEASQYKEALQQEYVMVDVEERQEKIITQMQQLEARNGWVISMDDDLLAEVTQLVEYPTVFSGTFHEDFLSLPEAILITAMKEHQRFFAVRDHEGKLLPHFVSVRNGTDEHIEQVVKGNEKVLKARLTDADFFFTEDMKLPLAKALETLERTVYHEQLGSIAQRMLRVQYLAMWLGEQSQLGASTLKKLERAAKIHKADLATQVVGEFPELEGIIGEIYANIFGEDKEVASAFREHYLPKVSGGELPVTEVGTLLALADKIEAIVASFGIGLQPTGSQDPYGLRRKAAGVIQILLQDKWKKLSITMCCNKILAYLSEKKLLKRSPTEVSTELQHFFAQRLRSYLVNNIENDIVETVLSQHIDYPIMIVSKANLLQQKLNQADFKQDCEAFKRVANLALKVTAGGKLQPSLLKLEAEKELFRVWQKSHRSFVVAQEQQDIIGMYDAIKQTVPAINRFFDEVMVMAKNQQVRENRLQLLKVVTELTLSFADFGKISIK